MTTLMIQDLESSKVLTRKELSAVRGGFAVGLQGGNQVVNGNSLVNINAPTQTVTDIHPDFKLGIIAASPGAGMWQY